MVFGRFRPNEARGFAVGEDIAGAAILSSLQSEDNPTGEWIEAWLIASADQVRCPRYCPLPACARGPEIYRRLRAVAHVSTYSLRLTLSRVHCTCFCGPNLVLGTLWIPHAISGYTCIQNAWLFEVNHSARWYYNWSSSAAKDKRLKEHVFEVYVLSPSSSAGSSSAFQVVAVSCSPSFKLLSFRRAPAETRKRGSDEISDATSGDVRADERAAKSPSPDSTSSPQPQPQQHPRNPLPGGRDGRTRQRPARDGMTSLFGSDREEKEAAALATEPRVVTPTERAILAQDQHPHSRRAATHTAPAAQAWTGLATSRPALPSITSDLRRQRSVTSSDVRREIKREPNHVHAHSPSTSLGFRVATSSAWFQKDETRSPTPLGSGDGSRSFKYRLHPRAPRPAFATFEAQPPPSATGAASSGCRRESLSVVTEFVREMPLVELLPLLAPVAAAYDARVAELAGSRIGRRLDSSSPRSTKRSPLARSVARLLHELGQPPRSRQVGRQDLDPAQDRNPRHPDAFRGRLHQFSTTSTTPTATSTTASVPRELLEVGLAVGAWLHLDPEIQRGLETCHQRASEVLLVKSALLEAHAQSERWLGAQMHTLVARFGWSLAGFAEAVEEVWTRRPRNAHSHGHHDHDAFKRFLAQVREVYASSQEQLARTRRRLSSAGLVVIASSSSRLLPSATTTSASALAGDWLCDLGDVRIQMSESVDLAPVTADALFGFWRQLSCVAIELRGTATASASSSPRRNEPSSPHTPVVELEVTSLFQRSDGRQRPGNADRALRLLLDGRARWFRAFPGGESTSALHLGDQQFGDYRAVFDAASGAVDAVTYSWPTESAASTVLQSTTAYAYCWRWHWQPHRLTRNGPVVLALQLILERAALRADRESPQLRFDTASLNQKLACVWPWQRVLRAEASYRALLDVY